MSEEKASPRPASTVVRLFPLPDLVLFPGVAQPLHVFEPRYRQLLADALASDRCITMALLQPGWEHSYHKQPPIHPGVCLGRIHQEEMLPDGRYNLLLHGERRARIVEELPPERLYRTARVEWLEDVEVSSPARADQLRQQMIQDFTRWARRHKVPLKPFRQLLEHHLAPHTLCDVLAFALPLPLEAKQRMLEEVLVEQRVDMLLEQLGIDGTTPRFPPDFSPN